MGSVVTTLLFFFFVDTLVYVDDLFLFELEASFWFIFMMWTYLFFGFFTFPAYLHFSLPIRPRLQVVLLSLLSSSNRPITCV